MNNTLTALRGVKVGHSTQLDKLTGTTVVIFEKDYPIAYKSYGGDPGTFNTDAFRNGRSSSRGNAIFISGGSWAGLTAGGEIIKRLIEKKIGYKIEKIINPNITGAIVYDLGTRIEQYNPTFAREAVDSANTDPVERGNVGAGTGTSVGKFHYQNNGREIAGMKAGVGCARVDIGNEVIISALSVVNALGNIILPDGTILAGNRGGEENTFETFEDFTKLTTQEKANTTISIVGLNADLKTRENYERVAHIATQEQVRAINPVHTSLDGDTIFIFSNEEIKSFLSPLGKKISASWWWTNLTVDIIGQAAAKAVQESIYDACYKAKTIKLEQVYKGIIPSVDDYAFS